MPSFSGGTATRNHWAQCGGMVFGSVLGETDEHTIYVGTLDDPSRFHPKMSLFTRDRPDWAEVKAELTEFETMPH